MPGCGKADASMKAEVIRRVVAAVAIPAGEGRRVSLTLSAGVAEGRGTAEELAQAAEGALRRARDAGRDRVEVA